MATFNIHQAKTHLSKLVDRAARGETVVIAKAGKPVARLTPLESSATPEIRRRGFMAGEIAVPPDFDAMGADRIEQMFSGA